MISPIGMTHGSRDRKRNIQLNIKAGAEAIEQCCANAGRYMMVHQGLVRLSMFEAGRLLVPSSLRFSSCGLPPPSTS